MPPNITIDLSALVQLGFGLILSFMFEALHGTVRDIRAQLKAYNDAMIKSEQWQIAHVEAHSVATATHLGERDAVWRELNLLRQTLK
jgi:hypothetical protein